MGTLSAQDLRQARIIHTMLIIILCSNYSHNSHITYIIQIFSIYDSGINANNSIYDFGDNATYQI